MSKNLETDFDSYDQLSSSAKTIAQIYAVVSPCVLTQRETINILDIVDLLRKEDRKLPSIRSFNDEIFGAGMGLRFQGGPYDRMMTVTKEAVLPLSLHAHRDGNLLPTYHAHFKSSRYKGITYDALLHAMMHRCLVVSGQYKVLEAMVNDGLAPPNWDFLLSPFSDGLWSTLPTRYVDDALRACLSETIYFLSEPNRAIDLCERFGHQPEEHCADIGYIRVLQGRFDEAKTTFTSLPKQNQQTKAWRTGFAATQALIALLDGDNQNALLQIQNAIAHELEGTRKKYAFPTEKAFALALIALIRLDTPESNVLLNDLLRTAKRLKINAPEVTLIRYAQSVKGKQYFMPKYPNLPGYELFLHSYAFMWLAKSAWTREPIHTNLEITCELALSNTYEWLYEEAKIITQRVRDHELHVQDESEQDEPRIRKRSLTHLFEPIPQWERSVRALEQLAHIARQDQSNQANSTTVDKEKRLIWVVDTTHWNVTLRAVEQRRNKNGSWSKGRRVALKRLAEETDSFDYLRDEDRKACNAIRYEYYGAEGSFVLGTRGLFELVGHPNIYSEGGASISVVRQDPELSVYDNEEGATVISLNPTHWIAEGNYAYSELSTDKLVVTEFNPTLKSLYQTVGLDGLVLPAESKSRALDAISGLVTEIRVQSSEELITSSNLVPADSDPWVVLRPLDEGLSVSIVVEPIEDSELYYSPGAGGKQVVAMVGGQSVKGVRDLEKETLALDQLIELCPYLRSRPSERSPLILTSQIDCLNLIEQLHEQSVRCKWPRGEPIRIAALTTQRSLSVTVTPIEQWLEISGKLIVDEQTVIELKRMLELLEANPNSRFLQLDAGEFLALSAQFRQQLDDLSSIATIGKNDSLRTHQLTLPFLDELLTNASVESDANWTEHRVAFENALAVEPALPNTLQAELRPYQVDGFRWLSRLSRIGAGACLADDMGLGKTLQSLAVILERAKNGPTLVVAPTSVVFNWIDEARRFAPTLNIKLCVASLENRASLYDDPSPFDLYVTSYTLLANDIDTIAAIPWHTAVLDEAQAIKNAATARAKAARQITADFKIATTGTPIQNNLMDLHSLFSVLNPGLLGSQKRFRETFAEPIERNNDDDVRARLRRVIAPFVLRRLKAEVLDDLPERTEIELHVQLSKEEAALYEALRQRAVQELEEQDTGDDAGTGDNQFQIFKHLTRLRLACCNPQLVLDDGAMPIESSKLSSFGDLLHDLLANRHKVLVFSQFVRHLKIVQEFLDQQNISYQYLDGTTPLKERAVRVANFQSGEGDVFLISLKAGGTGLNLTAADYVIHLDPWWNPAVEDQASDRSHRIGQTRPVTIYRLITEGTIEERVVALHHRKRDLADRLLQGTDEIAYLSSDELYELLAQPMSDV